MINLTVDEATIERAAKALWEHARDVEGVEMVTDDWDFGPAEYMRHIYIQRARVALAALNVSEASA